MCQLQTAMKLDHWHITLEDDWPGHLDDSDAAAWRSESYNRAKLYFDGPDDDMEHLRQNVVHELVHLILRDLDRVIESLKDHINPAAWHLIDDRFDHEREQAVEALAFAVAPLLPLPVKDESEASDR